MGDGMRETKNGKLETENKDKIDSIAKLDLKEFIASFTSFLAREKPLFLQGDIKIHYKFIKMLFNFEFNPPKNVKNLDTELMHIKKSGVLRICEIYEFIKIVDYFLYLKTLPFTNELKEWIDKIVIPGEIIEISNYFDKKGELKLDIDERFLAISKSLQKNKENIKLALQKMLLSKKLTSYLVDRQIHYISSQEALLVRGGFNHVLKASVVGRSSSGFFYVVPEQINALKKEEAALLSKKDELIFEYSKKISQVFHRFSKFLSFINKEFDRFDNYQARVFFAKSKDLEFLLPKRDNKIVLKDFIHPALTHPVPIEVDFSKKVLLITGVNAGGKTMLLKSILSAVFLAKYLLPMKIAAAHSHIGSFKKIEAIIDDPQNVKNDISTFAGRMVQFAKLFAKKDVIVGVDEIELGTDSDEAASLFKAVLEKLIEKEIKIVLTTHHKRLASMMALHSEVQLLAAIYDEKNQKPTFGFLQDSIGKSYAFETALRYGIPPVVVEEAKKAHGEEKERLNDLIQKNIELELLAKKKISQLDCELERVQKIKTKAELEKENAKKELDEAKAKLEKEYALAIEEAKRAAKAKEIGSIHKHLNIAHKIKKSIEPGYKNFEPKSLEVGDIVKYGKSKGVVLSLKKTEAIIECDGIRLRVPKEKLKRSGNLPKPKAPALKITTQKPKRSSVKLDLHGLRSEEAIEKLDKFLSDALITGYDEILVYHGIGSGKLAHAVKEFLKTYPKLKSFSDAPPNMGGYGATVIRL